MPKRKCAVCSEPIDHRHPSAIYCSKRCRKWAGKNGLTEPQLQDGPVRGTCKLCGAAFTTHHASKRYCTERCRLRAEHRRRNKRRRPRPTHTVTCRGCGIQFQAENRNVQRPRKYCSSECYAATITSTPCVDCGMVVPPSQRRGGKGAGRSRCQTCYDQRQAQGRDDSADAYLSLMRLDPCAYCGQPAQHIDHIIPQRSNGDDQWTNMTAACNQCNSTKGGQPLMHFLIYRGLKAEIEQLDAARRLLSDRKNPYRVGTHLERDWGPGTLGARCEENPLIAGRG